MDDNFQIPVTYNGKECLFNASLITYGYSYKIQVDVNGQQVFFEPDEERNFRAALNFEDLHIADKVDKALLQEIAQAIESIVK